MVKAEFGYVRRAVACKMRLDRVDTNHILVVLSLTELLLAASLAGMLLH